MRKIAILQLSLTVAIVTLMLIMVTRLPVFQIYAQEQNNTAAAITAASTAASAASLSQLVNAVALLIAAVAPLIVAGLAYVKANSQDPKINHAINTATSGAQMASLISNKALENKENIKSVIEFSLKAAPTEVQQAIDERKALIDKLNTEILATQAQLKRLTPTIPGEANADTIPDLPREKDFQ